MPRYIDADKVKKYLHEDDFGTPDERWKPESEFAKMIDATPTADVVEVKHGRWIKVRELSPRYVCDCCRHLYNNMGYKYCPNCGAKMDGKE